MENVKLTEEKYCVSCQGKLILVREDVFLRFDTPLRFFDDDISMDIYECENCHRLDFYNSSSKVSCEVNREEMIICPDCGNEHSRHINCPRCVAENGFTSGFRSRGKQKVEKKESRKKKDVPWEL